MAGQFRDPLKGMPALAGLPATVRNAPVPVALAWMQDNPKHPKVLPGAVENSLSAMRSLFAWLGKPNERGMGLVEPLRRHRSWSGPSW